MAVAETDAVEDMMMIATCSLTTVPKSDLRMKKTDEVLAVEGAGVDPTEQATGRKKHMHAIAEPERKDEQEQSGDEQRLWLEVINLRQDTAQASSEDAQ